VPFPEDVRKVTLEIYRTRVNAIEERSYQEYFGSDVPDERGGRYYSDVAEYLEDQRITQTQVLERIDSDTQSIVIGIPTYDSNGDPQNRIHYLEKVHRDIQTLKRSRTEYRDWPVELVINVNGLDDLGRPQRTLLDAVLAFQKNHSTDEAPVTVIHMPLGGMTDGERLPGKSNAVNAIVEYAKAAGKTILGIMDDDIEFSEGNLLSNIEFLIAKARELRSPVLTGSGFESLPAASPWGTWLRSHKSSGDHSIRGTSMFSFLFAFPPLPSFPINEDLYLTFYYADANTSGRAMRWRIHSNPKAKITFRLGDTFWSSLKQKYRFELADLWTLSLLGGAKKNFRYPRYGYRLLRAYLSSNASPKGLKGTLANARQSLPEFLFRNLLVNHWIGAHLWMRQCLGAPLRTTHWSRTVPPSTKQKPGSAAERASRIPANEGSLQWTKSQRGE